MEQNKTEKLIKQLVEAKKKHGGEKLKSLIDAVLQHDVAKTAGGCPEICGVGYYCSETLGRCVLDIG